MRSFLAYRLATEWSASPRRTIVVVTPDEKSASSIKADLEFFTTGRLKAEVCEFLTPDALPYTHLTCQPDIWVDRLRLLHKLWQKEPIAIIAPLGAVLRKLPPPSIFSKHKRIVRLHDRISIEELSAWLVEAGYINQPLVEDEGAFSTRGGIIDIYSPTLDRPVRCELDGDEITSIRTFDPSTQRSSFSISEFELIPARNIVLTEQSKELLNSRLKDRCDTHEIKASERREFAEGIANNFYGPATETLMPLFYNKCASLSDYLPEETLVYLDDEISLDSARKKLFDRLQSAREAAKHIEKIIAPDELFDDEILPALKKTTFEDLASGRKFQSITHRTLTSGLDAQTLEKRLSPADKPVAAAIKQIRAWQEMSMKIVVTCHTTTQAERVLDLLRWQGVASEIFEGSFSEVLTLGRSNVWVMLGEISGAFASLDDNIALLTDETIFGTKINRRAPVASALQTFTDFSELASGDLVIHKDHGIGRFLGLKNLDLGGTKNDFMLLQYLGEDKLYLPVWRINLISRYIGDPDHVSLDKLGGTRWSKTQQKVNSEIRTMALELLKIYAARKVKGGFAFSPPDHSFEEFEAAFPFDETPDQLRAIEETLKDMQKDTPADRLICGDVGYGKTEVAMRAAFKAVLDGKQVAVLVPTTVLAFQHYENFLTRFEKWPVRIEMLSRFRTASEQRHIVAELAKGQIDIIVGTHKLLGRDIKYSDLGLLVIDEEHHFGVAHKERIRKLKTQIDTITMTATPIPRTLHMSLAGLRDISIINTPPANRLAIRTFVAEFDETLIRGAIMGELARGGQVFFVHNRVETINRMAEMLAKIVPEARIVVGHGQMNEGELEDVMIRFLEKKANVLLCTTIIESGIDISSANTIIINRADRMGLAQLYQLRGRVGRSNVQAYAYLLKPKDEVVGVTAQKRLALLQRYTELGSGFQIAMHDLEIRGAGNLLGAQQSGHINAIGFEMYMELLERAIRQLQGQPEEVKTDAEISLPVEAFIPTSFVGDEGQRLVLYRRLAELENVEELDTMAAEITDRFGSIPPETINLLKVIEIKILARKLKVNSISYERGSIVVKFNQATHVNPQTVLSLVNKDPKNFAFRQPADLFFRHPDKNAKEILSATRSLLQKLF